MAKQPPDPLLEEAKRERRRERWKAFLTPMITLGSIVVSIGMLMFLIRSCQEQQSLQTLIFKERAISQPAKPLVHSRVAPR